MGLEALLACLLAATNGTSTATVADRPTFARVGRALDAAIAAGDIPGAVVLIGRGDEVLYEKAFGARAVEPVREEMTLDTIFDLASLTKPLATTLAVMKLVEGGQLALDAPVGRYLPELRRPKFEGVTIERLLRHTSGFGPGPRNPRTLARAPLAAIAAEKLAFVPGTSFAYSDLGFILLALVVEKVSGRPVDQVAGEMYGALGLRDTGFRPPHELMGRIAPTEVRGVVHDGTARRLGGVAGHAGLFSTARDLSTLLRALLDGGSLEGHRILAAETVKTMWTPIPIAGGQRALGWDVVSPYSARFSPYFPPGSLGHTGFTGTSIWVDPASRAYLILLTSYLHPRSPGPGGVMALRERVTAEAAAQLFPGTLSSAANGTRPQAPDMPEAATATRTPVLTGLAVLARSGFERLRGHSVALVTNQTGIDVERRRTIDVLAAAPGVRLAAVFAPEHGIFGREDRKLKNAVDGATKLPIYSLYGRTLRPTRAMLEGVDILVFDIQDVGARYYTYLSTLLYVIEAAASAHIPVMVLDRPNPIGGRVVEGPLLDPDLCSFTGPHPLPVRTGLTMGEFARLVVSERKIAVDLTVVPMEGWTRGRWYDETGLPWVNPSPNIRSVNEALLYSGIGLLEATNLSVGRGTDTPFELLGAPWVDGERAAAALEALGLSGVRFAPITFEPRSDAFASKTCSGVRLEVTDRDAIRPVTVALAIARVLRDLHPAEFHAERIQHMLGSRALLGSLLRGEPLDLLLARMDEEDRAFEARRAPFLLYP